MSARIRFCISLAAIWLMGNAAVAQERPMRLTPDEIAALNTQGPGAGTSGVAGIQSTVLSGDPAKAGPYTIEIRVPAHTRIAGHAHRDDRSAVVVSGKWYLGYGKAASEALVKKLLPGSFYTEPAGEAHFAMTKNEPAIVYITGFGPTSTDYVNPADTPRH